MKIRNFQPNNINTIKNTEIEGGIHKNQTSIITKNTLNKSSSIKNSMSENLSSTQRNVTIGNNQSTANEISLFPEQIKHINLLSSDQEKQEWTAYYKEYNNISEKMSKFSSETNKQVDKLINDFASNSDVYDLEKLKQFSSNLDIFSDEKTILDTARKLFKAPPPLPQRRQNIRITPQPIPSAPKENNSLIQQMGLRTDFTTKIQQPTNRVLSNTQPQIQQSINKQQNAVEGKNQNTISTPQQTSENNVNTKLKNDIIKLANSFTYKTKKHSADRRQMIQNLLPENINDATVSDIINDNHCSRGVKTVLLLSDKVSDIAKKQIYLNDAKEIEAYAKQHNISHQIDSQIIKVCSNDISTIKDFMNEKIAISYCDSIVFIASLLDANNHNKDDNTLKNFFINYFFSNPISLKEPSTPSEKDAAKVLYRLILEEKDFIDVEYAKKIQDCLSPKNYDNSFNLYKLFKIYQELEKSNYSVNIATFSCTSIDDLDFLKTNEDDIRNNLQTILDARGIDIKVKDYKLDKVDILIDDIKKIFANNEEFLFTAEGLGEASVSVTH